MIYLVEDDDNIRKLVSYALTKEGYKVKGFAVPSEFWNEIKTEIPDLVMLDIMLPQEDGLSILKKLRTMHETEDLPIIMLTAKVEDIDKIKGLTMGADDYMTKPFNPLELVTRVKSQLRRYRWYNTKEDKKSEEFHIRGLDIWKDRHLCTLNGKDLELTPMEFDIVWLLCENANKVVDTEQLFETVWKEKYLENNNNTVMAHVARIREKMHEVPRKPKYIKTVWGVGYKIDD